MFRKALLGLLIVSSSHVFAAESVESIKAEIAKMEEAQDSCLKEAVSNAEMGECSGLKYKAADALLNKVYKEQVAALKKEIAEEKDAGPLGQLGKETLKRLVKAQKTWIAFRDAECELAGTTMLFGSGEGLEISSCMVEITVQRTLKLGEFFGSDDPK